jgi:hypothetical protein
MRWKPSRWEHALAVTAAAVLAVGALAADVSARSGSRAAEPASAEAPPSTTAPTTAPMSLELGVEAGTGDRPSLSVRGELAAGTVVLQPEVQLGGSTPSADPMCGSLDRPETGVQGDVPLADQLSGRAREGYSCGLSLVGASTLGDRGGNGNMVWAGDCAYIAGDGIAVVDVSDPTAPVHTTTLHGPGSDMSIETIAAVDVPGRQILAAGRYGFQFDFGLAGQAPVDIYDVSDCAAPRLLTTFLMPGAVHNLTFSADGTRLWSTIPLQAADTTDPANPVYLGSLDDALRTNGPLHLEYAHEVWPSEDGNRILIGGQLFGDEATMIFDVANWPAEPPRLLSSFAGPGHSVRTATIGGRDYVLHSDESIVSPISNGCVPSLATPAGGASEPMLTDVTDLAEPARVGTLSLAINQPEHCLDALASGVNGSSHYQDVDDPDDTTFAMVSMWHSGLRLFDLRDPANPTEVAYFNPGLYDLGLSGAIDAIGLPGRGMDMAWAHVRYDAETGHIWLATRAGGFWVLELQPQVRAALDLPEVPTTHPDGGPVRPAGQVAPATGLTGGADALAYCTLTGRVPLTAPTALLTAPG